LRKTNNKRNYIKRKRCVSTLSRAYCFFSRFFFEFAKSDLRSRLFKGFPSHDKQKSCQSKRSPGKRPQGTASFPTPWAYIEVHFA
jgi:hypothetical protein